MIHIFVETITPRIEYTFDFIFKSRAVDFVLTSDIGKFKDFSGKKINYSKIESDGVKITPSNLLFEETISEYLISESTYNGQKSLVFNEVVDPVATVFFLLSRYEEYTCKSEDEHGRFPFQESILKKFDWIEFAIADRCAEAILEAIEVESSTCEMRMIPSFDIDNTYAYKLKSGKRAVLSFGKDILTFNFKRIQERLKVWTGGRDPYDTFEMIKNISANFPLTKVFWLIGEYGKKDRNISIDNVKHQELIKEIDQNSEVCLHPSYASFKNVAKISKEREKLMAVLGKEVNASRQHFLRYSLPASYRGLIEAGFRHDYSMGFAERAGFKSGTARVHYWFDLASNKRTDLSIHPFVYMDGTLNEYMTLSISESKEIIDKLFKEVSQYGGDFCFIWHNETIGDYGKWKGWSDVLKFTLDLKK